MRYKNKFLATNVQNASLYLFDSECSGLIDTNRCIFCLNFSFVLHNDLNSSVTSIGDHLFLFKQFHSLNVFIKTFKASLLTFFSKGVTLKHFPVCWSQTTINLLVNTKILHPQYLPLHIRSLLLIFSLNLVDDPCIITQTLNWATF